MQSGTCHSKMLITSALQDERMHDTPDEDTQCRNSSSITGSLFSRNKNCTGRLSETGQGHISVTPDSLNYYHTCERAR